MRLTWQSAGTDDAGDQQADAGIVRGYWQTGPETGDSWSLTLIRQDDSLTETGEWAWDAPDEACAKEIAQAVEDGLISLA